MLIFFIELLKRSQSLLQKFRRSKREEVMSSSKAIVAASVGVVEALKDQGICRWNSTLRYVGQKAKSQVRSFSQANSKLSSPSSSALSKVRDEKMKRSEESLRTVMYLSCWGPNN
ncbi:hypothetical protein C1H46_036034 [Malus baccata]|uniref:Wound-responsive family protein n=1 Tax=Malus baccata TaxID=106549 RepID=A0A540KWB8_MALBA|nr:hypothetical protein C1H46_036034 [Malus baccata]